MNERFVSVVIVGARGRMGRALIRAVMESDDLTLAGAVDRTQGPSLGQDAGRLCGMPESGVMVTDQIRPPRGSVVVDFSLPEATETNVHRCLEFGAPLVLGTTGLSEQAQAFVQDASKQIPIVSAANFSVGVTLLAQLASLAAKALGPSFETEIVELHHRHKRDAPSGTALRVGKAIADATGRDFAQVAISSRGSTTTQRANGEIGVAALRGGDSVGEHTVMFLGDGERLELIHRATDRGIFARGALRAARWLTAQGPGLYDMVDVLGMPSL